MTQGVPNKKNLNEYQIQSGRVRKENGEAVNWADRIDTVINEGTVIGSITVTPSGEEVKADITPLEGRHTVYIINDTSALIFVGFDTVPIVGSVTPIVIFSGEAIGIRLSPDVYKPIFAVTREYTVPVRIIEVR